LKAISVFKRDIPTGWPEKYFPKEANLIER
jgi:hypothetical protein